MNNIPFGGNNNGFNRLNNNSYNDYFSRMNMPHYDIIQVRGKNGAEALQMGPNSRVLLLDENDPLVWFVETDGAGYKTITPYQITPYQPAPPIDLNTLEARITNLEERLNAKSNSTTNKQKRSNSNSNVTTTATTINE